MDMVGLRLHHVGGYSENCNAPVENNNNGASWGDGNAEVEGNGPIECM